MTSSFKSIWPDAFSLYVHIPFCSHKCPYCAFYKETWTPEAEQQFLNALLQEIRHYAQLTRHARVTTLYLGGGTPNKLSHRGLTTLFTALHDHFNIAQNTSQPLPYNYMSTPRILFEDAASATSREGEAQVALPLEGEERSDGTESPTQLNVASGRGCPAGRSPRRATLAPSIEISIEMNPEHVDDELLAILKHFGVNRVSLGIQSFLDNELRFLGRAHTRKSIDTAIRQIQAAGFENINLDFMFALPGSTLETVQESVRKALLFNPTHLSTYSLSIEYGTPFAKSNIKPANEETEIAQYSWIIQELERHGFDHYETSAFAKPGYESRHNLAYWELKPYLGIGPSAHSYIGPYAFQNPADMAEYCHRPVSFQEDNFNDYYVDRKTHFHDYLLTGLRLKNGVCLDTITARFQMNPEEELNPALGRMMGHDLLVIEGNRLKATAKGRYLLNDILVELLP